MSSHSGISQKRLIAGGSWRAKMKIPLLCFGDIFLFYGSLALTLFIRYGEISLRGTSFDAHFNPFSLALGIWLLIFYIGGLYEKQIFNREVLVRRFFPLVGIGSLALILLFYFVPSYGIAPKANLFIFIAIFTVAGYAWRSSFIVLLRERAGIKARRVMLVGDTSVTQEVAEYITKNPTSDYELVLHYKEGLRGNQSPEQFAESVIVRGINSIVVPGHLEHDPGALRMLYYAFMSGIEVVSLADFYERLFDRVSIAELQDSWLIKNLPLVARRNRFVKYFAEALLALILLLLFSPIMVVAAILVAITSAGPVLYTQVRVGQNEERFTLFKFRSMYAQKDKNPDADAASPTWSTQNDPRVTPVGRILRATHIDEFPQLFNVLRGEMSFVGPRPERPEFTAELEKKIPYYELRYVLKPGITGWAQINYPYGASVGDAYQKLQYEIYYLKNRSLLLDAGIIIKTIRNFFITS